ncbi:hypothetical protein JCM5353_006599 [Sporobolomyces roseus]
MTTVDQLEDMSTLNQTSTTKPKTNEMAHKIDRLSLLPNELLDHIFDLAYSIDTPSAGPLSKQLLPFHITGIYRRIRLSKFTTFLNLVYTVTERPTLAISIQTLELVANHNFPKAPPAGTRYDLSTFIRSLTRLQTLKIGNGYSEMSRILHPSSSLLGLSDLPALSHLSAPVPTDYPNEPQLSLDRFLTLRSLTLTDYDDDFEPNVPLHPTSLPLVTHLVISGVNADDPSIASLCLACPSLTHLSLYAYEAVYARLLTSLPATLLHLGLGTVDTEGNIGMGGGNEDCSAELSRFPLLRSLSLDKRMFSSELPEHISNLQHLETLKLVGDEIFVVDVVELLSASTRPPSLRTLELCLETVKVGSRLEVDESSRLVGIDEPEEQDWEVSGDWELPRYVRVGATYGYEEMYGIRKLAAQCGVEIRGNLYEAVEMVDVYFLELANIAIYRCFRYNTLEPYNKLQDRGLGSRLPPLDLDSLDPKNLKLVKTDLPDEGWFALSLEAADE